MQRDLWLVLADGYPVRAFSSPEMAREWCGEHHGYVVVKSPVELDCVHGRPVEGLAVTFTLGLEDFIATRCVLQSDTGRLYTRVRCRSPVHLQMHFAHQDEASAISKAREIHERILRRYGDRLPLGTDWLDAVTLNAGTYGQW